MKSEEKAEFVSWVVIMLLVLNLVGGITGIFVGVIDSENPKPRPKRYINYMVPGYTIGYWLSRER